MAAQQSQTEFMPVGVSLIMGPIVRQQYRGSFPPILHPFLWMHPTTFQRAQIFLQMLISHNGWCCWKGLIYSAFRDKVGLSWVSTLTSTPETRDSARSRPQGQGALPHILTLPHCPSQKWTTQAGWGYRRRQARCWGNISWLFPSCWEGLSVPVSNWESLMVQPGSHLKEKNADQKKRHHYSRWFLFLKTQGK